MPAVKNKRALNSAWVSKWKKAKKVKFNPREVIITPNWERVESAIIFFISHSAKATVPAINMVIVPIISKASFQFGIWLNS